MTFLICILIYRFILYYKYWFAFVNHPIYCPPFSFRLTTIIPKIFSLFPPFSFLLKRFFSPVYCGLSSTIIDPIHNWSLDLSLRLPRWVILTPGQPCRTTSSSGTDPRSVSRDSIPSIHDRLSPVCRLKKLSTVQSNSNPPRDTRIVPPFRTRVRTPWELSNAPYANFQ